MALEPEQEHVTSARNRTDDMEKICKRVGFYAAPFFGMAWISLTLAQSGPPSETSLELYEGPVAVEQPELNYPFSARRSGKEGWVELNFMVNGDGDAYEITVADNVGDEAFIRSAIEHLEASIYQPARIGDEIVDGSARQIYRFYMEGDSDGARTAFISRYRQFNESLQDASDDELASALQRLEGLDVLNIYEFAYLSFARSLYAERNGDSLEQMKHLQRALMQKGDSVYETYLSGQDSRAHRVLFQLQVVNGYYVEALRTYSYMWNSGVDDEGVVQLRPIVDQIELLRDNEQAVGVSGQIQPNGYWDITLLKDEFQLDDIQGSIHELKLRCQGRFLFFEFDPEVAYNLSDGVGFCRLQVIGDPATTFTLVQR